jgi:hypothetical protein
LIGTSYRESRIRFPKDWAFQDLDLLGKTHPEAILFRLCERPQWKRADSGGWESVTERSLRLIAGALAGERREVLEKHTVGGYGSNDVFRQARSRTGKALRQILGRGNDYQPLPDSPNGGVQVADDLLIFGAVNDATFRKVPEKND